MERKPFGGLTPEEIEAIAERAAEKAIERMYANVGKGVLRKLGWLLTTVAISLALWLAGQGALKT